MHIAFVESNAVGLGAPAAAKRAGHQVTYIGSQSFAGLIGGLDTVRQPAYTDRVIEIDSTLDEELLYQTLLKLKREEGLAAVLTPLDFTAAVVARVARRLEFPGTDPDAVELAQDKAACRRRLAENGIRSVGFAVVEDIAAARREAERLGYPLIAKPKRGCASIDAAKIRKPEDFEPYFATLDQDLGMPSGVERVLSRGETLIEQFAEGPMFSAEIAAGGGEHKVMTMTWRKRCTDDPFVELGSVVPAPVSERTATELGEYALSVVRCLGLDVGIFHVEVIYGPKGPVLVEVNPRIMGGNVPIAFRLATDVDPFSLLVDIHLTGKLPNAAKTVRPVRGAVTRSIAPSHVHTVREDIGPDWTQPFRPQLAYWNARFAPGQSVPRTDATFCPNHFQLVKNTSLEASLFAEWVIGITAKETGLPLRQSGEDYYGL